MINIVLYSDQVIPANEKVDVGLVALMKGRGSRIGYVPSGPDPNFRFFMEKQAYYARRGFTLDAFYEATATPKRPLCWLAMRFICQAETLPTFSPASGVAACWKNCVTGETVEDFSSAQVLVLS
jgi:hypothetical protein